MSIYDRIRELRIKKNWSMDELAKKVGYCGRSAISKVENGERQINHDMLIKYSLVFNVSPAYLLFGEDNTDYKSFGKNIPMLEKIIDGELIFSKEEHSATSDIDADFCFTVCDNSMSGARINSGDTVFIKDDKDVKNGDIVAVIIAGKITLKYWYYYPDQKKLVLNSATPNCEPLIYTGPEIKKVACLGKATSFISKLGSN